MDTWVLLLKLLKQTESLLKLKIKIYLEVIHSSILLFKYFHTSLKYSTGFTLIFPYFCMNPAHVKSHWQGYYPPPPTEQNRRNFYLATSLEFSLIIE